MKATAKLRVISLATFMAFVMNALLPFFAVYTIPSAQAAEQEELSSPFGEKILICTSNGFKWVAWEELQNEEHHPVPSNDYKCPLCYVAAHGLKVFLPASDYILTHTLSLGAPPLPFEEQHNFRIKRFLSGHFSRAPPHLT